MNYQLQFEYEVNQAHLVAHSIYACEVGSRGYGLHTETSDHDVRVLTIPTMRSLYGIALRNETIHHQTNGEDVVYMDFMAWLRSAFLGKWDSVEWLFPERVTVLNNVANYLHANRTEFLTRSTLQHALSSAKGIIQSHNRRGEVKYKDFVAGLRRLNMVHNMLHTDLYDFRLDKHILFDRNDLLAIKNDRNEGVYQRLLSVVEQHIKELEDCFNSGKYETAQHLRLNQNRVQEVVFYLEPMAVNAVRNL